MHHHRLFSVFCLLALSCTLLTTRIPTRALANSPAVPPQPQATWAIETVDAPRSFLDMGERYMALDSADHPHVAYGNDRLYYAWNDGSAWHSQVVDPAPMAGQYAALALDAADRPHISYGGPNSKSLKYAYLSGTTWISETVDSHASIYYGATSIAVDSAGYPHILYYNSNDYSLGYAYYDGTVWHLSHVEDNIGYANVPGRFSLVLDSGDAPHVAYFHYGNYAVKYAYLEGTTWTIELVDNDLPGADLSLALDSAGNPHLSYNSDDTYSLRYAYYDGTSWQIEDVEILEGFDSSLALDAAGHPHISYGHYLYNGLWELNYTWYDGTTWNTEVIEPHPYEARSTTLRFDSLGRPRLSYFDGLQLVYLHDDGSGWTREPIDDFATAGAYASLDLFPDGRPAVAYCQGRYPFGDCQVGRYAYYDGSSWQFDTFDATPGSGDHTSMALDNAGYPHIVYDSFNPITFAGGLRYAYFDGSAWVTSTLAVDGLEGSLVLDDADYPHISYNQDGYIHYAYYDGSSWQDENIGQTGWGSLLALDPTGRPFILFGNGTGRMELAWYDGGAWQFEIVDPSVNVSHKSLAVDEAGRPHIVYVGPTWQLKYAYKDASGWQIEYLGIEGSDVSLALEVGDLPSIAYLTADGLKYARYDGLTWHAETVDGTPDVGYYASLALDADRLPHIAYHNYSTGDLLYAAPAGPCLPVEQVTAGGPATLPAGIPGAFTAAYEPFTATSAILNWDNGNVGASAVYSWTVPGSYTVTVTATNPCSQVQDSYAVDVFCQPPQSAAVQGPTLLPPGGTGAFQAGALPITTSIPITWTWDNGAIGPTAVYSWTEPGLHRVVVTATNPCGQVSAGYTVTVPAPPCSPVTTADFTWGPLAPTAGQPAWFTATAGPTMTAWPTETIDSVGDWQHSGDDSLVLDSLGYPHLCYRHGDSNLAYAYYDGSQWIIELVDTTIFTGYYCSLALDPAGHPHIAYMGATVPFDPPYARYAYYDGSSWQLETIDDEQYSGYSISLVLDDAGNPRVSYVRTSFHRGLVYSYRDGSGWHPTTVDASGLPLGKTVLRLTAGNTPHIVYNQSPGTIKYAHFSGGTWQLETLAAGRDADLAFDSAGQMHIAYRAQNPGWALMYDGQVVDGIPVVDNDDGQPALVLDAGDHPHILYHDPVAGDLLYAVSDGNVWFTETVATTGLVGAYPSLALDHAGQSHFACYERNNHELQYGWQMREATPPITFTWDLGDGAVASGQVISHTYAQGGSYTVSLVAANCAGGGQAMAAHTLDVGEASCDPVQGLVLNWEPLTPSVGQVVTLTAAASGTAPISFTWRLGDGTTGQGGLITHTYTGAGVYTISLDAANCATATISAQAAITVLAACAPVAGLDMGWAPLTPTAGQVLTLTATASGTAPITFSWNLGDGSHGEGAVITHSYALAGTHTLTLTAGNGCGTATITATVVVASIPAQEWKVYLPLTVKAQVAP